MLNFKYIWGFFNKSAYSVPSLVKYVPIRSMSGSKYGCEESFYNFCFKTVVCKEAILFSFLFERLICAKLFKSSEVDRGYD